MKVKFNASVLRIILSVSLLLIIAGGILGFRAIYTQLVKIAQNTAEISTKATSGQEEVRKLQNAQLALKQNEAIAKKIRNMIATNINYTYQDQIVYALKALGASSNVKVTNVTFTSTSQLATPTPAPTAAVPTPTDPAAASSSIPADIKLTETTIAIESPLKYEDLLTFLHNIEQNTMAMKVSMVSLSGGGSGEGDKKLVSCETLKIGVYTR